MNCQRCKSSRVLRTNAHACDHQTYELNTGFMGPDYAPDIPDICADDYLCPDICLDCGQTQGEFPKPLVSELESGEGLD